MRRLSAARLSRLSPSIHHYSSTGFDNICCLAKNQGTTPARPQLTRTKVAKQEHKNPQGNFTTNMRTSIKNGLLSNLIKRSGK
jgi:hypothetical protein